MREAERGHVTEADVRVPILLARSHRPRTVGSFLELEKARKWTVSWGLQKEHSCADTANMSQRENELLAPMARKVDSRSATSQGHNPLPG